MLTLARKRWVLSLCCLVAVLPPLHAAQRARGVLTGIVLDTTGAPVAGARVFWQEADGKSPHALRTDQNGRFRTKPVSTGLYELRAEARGMWSEWEHNALVRTGPGNVLTLRLVRRTPPAVKRASQSKPGG